jgi:hypothetical protein
VSKNTKSQENGNKMLPKKYPRNLVHIRKVLTTLLLHFLVCFRRAIYSLRQPTNRQRAYAAASAFISSAAALAKEASNQFQDLDENEGTR